MKTNIPIKQVEGSTWVLDYITGEWLCQHDCEIYMEEVEDVYYGNGEIVADSSKVPVCSVCDEQL